MKLAGLIFVCGASLLVAASAFVSLPVALASAGVACIAISALMVKS